MVSGTTFLGDPIFAAGAGPTYLAKKKGTKKSLFNSPFNNRIRCLRACVYFRPFFFEFRSSVHPSTNGLLERRGKERQVVERDRKESRD